MASSSAAAGTEKQGSPAAGQFVFEFADAFRRNIHVIDIDHQRHCRFIVP